MGPVIDQSTRSRVRPCRFSATDSAEPEEGYVGTCKNVNGQPRVLLCGFKMPPEGVAMTAAQANVLAALLTEAALAVREDGGV